MTTKSAAHRQEVDALISSIVDCELRHEMRSIADGYLQLRQTLKRAIAQLRTISADIGFDDDESERMQQLRDLIDGVRSDELHCLHMVATLDDAPMTTTETAGA